MTGMNRRRWIIAFICSAFAAAGAASRAAGASGLNVIFGSGGGGEDPSIFARVHQRFPDVLLIPENPNVGMYSVCAPLGSIRQNRMETPDLVRQVYPYAFSVIDTTIEKTPAREPELIDCVPHILMFHGAGPVSAVVQRVYREAAARR
jgi:hypothetical protein